MFLRYSNGVSGGINLFRCRYGNPTSLAAANSENYEKFSKHFIHHFAPEILKVYLQQVELWVSKQAWLSKICLSSTIAFLDEWYAMSCPCFIPMLGAGARLIAGVRSIKPSATWKHLNPHIGNLISHVLFPLLCQSDEDLELFESDPAEYLTRKINFYEEISAPDVASTNFLITLSKSRRKQTFTVINFINDVVNR